MAMDHATGGRDAPGSPVDARAHQDAALRKLVIAGNLMAAQIETLLENRHLDRKTSSLLLQSSAAWDLCLRKLQERTRQ